MPANVTDPLVRQFQPSNPFVVIWRYMNIEKLEEFVESSKLIFTSLDKFPDQYGGHNTLIGKILANIQSDSAKLAVLYEDLITTSIRESSYVNCWTEGDAENAAFWELYGKRGDVVAIRSTYSKLRNVLPDGYVIGCIEYTDYNSSSGFAVARSNSAYPFFEHVYHKRLEFRYENEVRAARIPRVGESQVPSTADVLIPNPSDLINTVLVRRSDPVTVRKKVENLCNKYELNYRESRINDHPLQIRLTEQQRDRFMSNIVAAKIPSDLPEKSYAIVITRLLNEALRGQ